MHITTKGLFSSVLLLIFASCGVPESDYLVLKEQNKILEERLLDLENRLREADYLNQHAQVVLANTELKEIHSKANGETYKVKILLPRNYHQNTSKLPVLYVTDAETNFGGIGYIVQRLIKDQLIPPMIVVGIAYGTDYKTFYELRSRDLTPVEDKKLKMGGKIDPTGGAEQFCEFLSAELFQMIEDEYRVDKDHRAIYGHSYGGLFASYVLLHKTDLFNKYLILSPSLWYNNEYLIDEAENFAKTLNSTKVYMGSGEHEGRIDDLQTMFAAKLKSKGLDGLFIKDEVLSNETHRTIFGPGFTNGMRYLFEK